MKKCEICQKPSTDLAKTLTTGPNGFRRYKACPGCRKGAEKKIKAPIIETGTQIAYIPTHANGNINHQDVEFGFVVSKLEDAYFCRYWSKGRPGELRTLANSELTPGTLIVEHKSVPQIVVKKWLVEIGVRES